MSLTVYPTGPSSPRQLSITRVLEDGIELNWLPPTEPSGEVHYVIYYTPDCGIEQSIDTRSNLTHYNLTGLEMNRVYTNITVQAVNSAGRSDRSAVIAQYNHTQPVGESIQYVIVHKQYSWYCQAIQLPIPSKVYKVFLRIERDLGMASRKSIECSCMEPSV